MRFHGMLRSVQCFWPKPHYPCKFQRFRRMGLPRTACPKLRPGSLRHRTRLQWPWHQKGFENTIWPMSRTRPCSFSRGNGRPRVWETIRKHATERDKRHDSYPARRTGSAQSARCRLPPVAIFCADALCLHERSTLCARTGKHSAFCLCHLYRTSKSDRGRELSARYPLQSVVCFGGRFAEYSGLCHRHQRERGPNHFLQNLDERRLIPYRYLSSGLLSRK